MAAQQFSPVSQLIEMVLEEHEAPEPKQLKAVLSYSKDYELSPDGKIRLRANIRSSILLKLAELHYPKPKSAEQSSESTKGISVIIQNYQDNGNGRPEIRITE